MKEIYCFQVEVNDKGWQGPYRFFEKVEDAVKSMRMAVARRIKFARAERRKVHHLKVWDDRPTGHLGELRSQTITVWLGKDFHEFRVFAYQLHDAPCV